MRPDERLRPYVPGFVVDWLREHPDVRHRSVDGTLAFVDVSGFTTLTERLAARGKVGAEEMTGILDRTFGELLGVAYSHGAWLVKWGGDAVLLLFQGEGHAVRAATAALGMRRAMDVVGRVSTESGPVRLRVSTGLHSGAFDFFLVGSTHRELVITGPGPSTTAAMEAAAAAGQVAVSGETAALLPAGTLRTRPDGVVLVVRSPGAAPSSPLRPGGAGGVDLGLCLPAATRDYLLSGDDDAEHRLVTVAFVEFSGVDRLLAEQGPGATTAAVDGVIRCCQESAVRHGVTFWETDISKDGGKVMLVAGVPATSGGDEDAVLAVARDVVEAGGPLSVRVGVNSGRVFFGQFGPPYRRTMSVKGDAVNLAARLMGKAGPGEVLAAVQVPASARTPFAVEALPPFTVKGKTQLVHACRVGPVREDALPDDRDEGPFVGRAADLARLAAHWRLAREGRLQVCELVGDPGVGKTRLVREVVAHVGARRVEVRADRYAGASAYAPFRRLVRGLLGAPADAAPPEVGRALLAALASAEPQLRAAAPLLAAVLGAQVPPTPEADAVDERFRAQRQEEAVVDLLVRLLPEPATLVLDDAHLLDASSVSLLRRLVARAAAAPWLLVVCRRAETAAPLEGVDGVATGVLGPLDPSSSLELVHALTEATPLPPHEVAQLMRRAGGNPLFLAELAAATASGARVDDLPDSVEHVVAARIDALDRRDRALLRAAAVLGMEVRRSTLVALADRAGLVPPADALDRLAGFLEPDGDDLLRFRQALVQETAYEGLPYSRRAVLHGHVGDVLADRTGPEADAVLSLHFLRAERYPDAWRSATRAADSAWTVNAPAEAAELYERALAAARHVAGAAGATGQLWERLSDARSRLGAFREAAEALTRARRLVPGPPTDRVRLLRKSALTAERLGAYAVALRWLAEGRRLLAALPSGPERDGLDAELLVARGTLRHWQGRHELAVADCRSAADLAAAAGAELVLADALVWLDVSELMLGQGDGAAARRALALLRERGDDPWQEGRCLNELGIRAYYAGDWDEAARCWRACQAANARAGDTWAASVAEGNAAEVLVEQGRSAEAEPLLRDALRTWRASDAAGQVAFGLRLLARIAARAGRHDEADDLLATARRTYLEHGEHGEVVETDARRAEARLLRGDAAGALALVETTLRSAEGSPELATFVPLLQRVRGLALTALVRYDEARSALDAALAVATARGAEHEAAFTRHALLALDTAAGPAPSAAAVAACTALLDRLGVVAVAVPRQAVRR